MREEASYLSQEETVIIARKPLRGYKCASKRGNGQFTSLCPAS